MFYVERLLGQSKALFQLYLWVFEGKKQQRKKKKGRRKGRKKGRKEKRNSLHFSLLNHKLESNWGNWFYFLPWSSRTQVSAPLKAAYFVLQCWKRWHAPILWKPVFHKDQPSHSVVKWIASLLVVHLDVLSTCFCFVKFLLEFMFSFPLISNH